MSSSMHIVFVSNDTTAMVNHRIALIRAVRAAGCRCTVLGPSDSCAFGTLELAVRALTALGAEYIPWEVSRRGVNPLREMQAIWSLRALYIRLRPDLVHHVAHKSVIYGSFAAYLAGVKAVVNAVSGMGYAFTEGSGGGGLLGRIIIGLHRLCHGRSGSRTIFQNPEDLSALVVKGVVPALQARLIKGSGVDTEVFFPADSLPAEAVVLLPARMLWDKGIGEAIEAVRILRREKVDITLRLVGGVDQGNPAAISLEQLNKWQHEGLCQWLGHVSDMPHCFREARICCLPSYREGLPKALVEAAGCGLPLITCDVPGCREVVQSGVNGLLVPPRDSRALATALRELIMNDERCSHMGRISRQMALKEFATDHVVEKHVAIYRELLGNHW